MKSIIVLFILCIFLGIPHQPCSVTIPDEMKAVMKELEPFVEKGKILDLEKRASSLLEKQTTTEGKVACLTYLIEAYKAQKNKEKVHSTLDTLMSVAPDSPFSRMIQLLVMTEEGRGDEFLPKCRAAAASLPQSEKKDFDKRCRTVVAQSRTIQPQKLFSAFEENEVSAEDAYKGKLITLSGKVGSIETSATGRPEVVFYVDKSRIASVVCQFPSDSRSEVAKLKKGKNVDIAGVCRGMFLKTVVKVEGCWIVE